MINYVDTLQSQYANSPRIVGLISAMNDAIAPQDAIREFYDVVFNVFTAKGFGLDIWGRIVGVGRNAQIDDPDLPVFGFKTEPQSPRFKPFDNAPFSGSGAQFQSFRLPDDLYRELILFKAAANIIYATAPNINKLLVTIFGNRAYYRVNGNMSATYVFDFDLTPFQRFIVYNLDLLPIPSGVEVTYEEL
jgi:hypothetical protein